MAKFFEYYVGPGNVGLWECGDERKTRNLFKAIATSAAITFLTIFLYQSTCRPTVALTQRGSHQILTPETLKMACPSKVLITNDDLQTHHTVKENFLLQKQLVKLQDVVLSTRKCHFMSRENPGEHVVDITYTFNEEGWKMLANTDAAPFMTFATRERLPSSNYWTLTLNYLQSKHEACTVKPTKKRMSVEDMHIDHISAHNGYAACRVMSYMTSILYLFIPKDMLGGELELHQRGYLMTMITNATAAVRPKENMLIQLRGDMPHRVQKFESRSCGNRISVTFVNYKLPTTVYNYFPKFEVARTHY